LTELNNPVTFSEFLIKLIEYLEVVVKTFLKCLFVLTLGIIFLVSGAEAKKKRKLPIGAYIKSAKIEILSGDIERYPKAIAFLDSLFMNYGPHAEALELMANIYVDYIEKASTPEEKWPYVKKMVAYHDSLKMCCENEEINKKYKKDCEKLVQVADSTNIKYWRQFYNSGIEQLHVVDESFKEMNIETDSAALAFMQKRLDAKIDSCMINMQVAISIDPSEYRTYVSIGSLYEKIDKYEKAIEWLSKGLEKTTSDRAILLLPIAYNYIQMNEYCKSIPYFKEYVELTPDDIGNMGNLAACYNNCKFYDSAVMVNEQILALDSQNVNAMISIGQYFNQEAASASSRQSQATDEAEKEKWQKEKMAYFDSSLVYFDKAFVLEPDNPEVVEQYALVNAILEKYEVAVIAFNKMVELKPSDINNWISLGDCNLYIKDYKNAVVAYEKVVELDETRVPIWENLVALYKELNMPAKEKDAEKKYQELISR